MTNTEKFYRIVKDKIPGAGLMIAFSNMEDANEARAMDRPTEDETKIFQILYLASENDYIDNHTLRAAANAIENPELLELLRGFGKDAPRFESPTGMSLKECSEKLDTLWRVAEGHLFNERPIPDEILADEETFYKASLGIDDERYQLFAQAVNGRKEDDA